MSRTHIHIPKEVAGVRIPRKVRRMGAHVPRSAVRVAAAAVASAVVAGIFAAVRGTRRGPLSE